GGGYGTCCRDSCCIVRTGEGITVLHHLLGLDPWALELIDPFHPEQTLKCTFAGGATDFIANNRVNWWCANDSSKGFAAGDLKKNSDGPWTVLYMAQGTSEGRDALVKTIWR
ncbi:hypothetical protein AB0P13_26625, partial [Rhodococcus pyridinivorans]|uniref:hypothetical protein n=1 Tax=Rhodococcus pyridinivorans TaxID=103816 RepID=UPI003439965E